MLMTDTESTAPLSIRLLGRFLVERDGQAVGGFSTDKTRALLAYLVIENDRSHRRQALAGLLWPEYPEAAARTSLRTALANLRHVLGDRQADPPFLYITRQVIGINPESKIWVDANDLGQLLNTAQTSHSDPGRLEEIVDLYGGSFLEGFSLSDSAFFDEWTLLRREHFERQMVSALDQLTLFHKETGNFQDALVYARKRVEADPLQESAQRELMWLLTASGRRAAALAQYEACRQLLAEELSVEPEKQTTRLYHEIRDGTLQKSIDDYARSVPGAFAVPDRLIETVKDGVERLVFVGRGRELGLLQAHLKKVSAGQGGVVFVLGGVGRGKSVLLAEFSRQIVSQGLCLAATGYCNAFSGPGDPYLPFRQVLEQLTGNLDDMRFDGPIAHEQSALIQLAATRTSQAIVKAGPDLVGTFLAGTSLLQRASAIAEPDAAWLDELRRLVQAKASSQSSLKFGQQAFIDQYVSVLRRVAQQVPLLIIIEDLHWADQGSIDLLLHLGRRLANSRILMLCAYRPDEVASRPGEAHHPVLGLVNELVTLHGDIRIDLAVADSASSQKFVNDLLDSEPNSFDLEFRRAMHDRTGGHPLFTVEMLRMLKEQGNLVQDPNGGWMVGQELVWDQVPARVEAVIQKRLGRLNPATYELLTVASVEGEEFSAEVVSRVLGKPERQVLHALSQDLGAAHRLLMEWGDLRTGNRHVSRFKFSHQLIQHYVYSHLAQSERRLLHEEVAQALERLFKDDIEEATIPLAYHYSQTDLTDKKLHYLTQAGHLARRRYDGRQAALYFSEALSLIPDDSSERFHLLAARADVYDILAEREAQKADVDTMLVMARSLADKALRCDALLALGRFYLATEMFLARQPALEARDIAQEIGDRVREAFALKLLSWEGRMGADLKTTHGYVREAAARFSEAGMPGEAAECLFMLTRRLPVSAKHILDLGAAEQAMALSRASADRRLEAVAQMNLAIAYTNQDKDVQALPLVEEALATQTELGDRRKQCDALDVRGVILARLGRRQEAAASFQRCLTLSEEIGSDWGVLGAVFGFWNYVFVADGEYESLLGFIDERLSMARQAGRGWFTAFLSWSKAQILSDVGQLDEAYAISQNSETQVTEGDPVAHIAVVQLEGVVKATLGRYGDARRDMEKALELAESADDQYYVSYPLVALADLALIEAQQQAIEKGVKQAKQASEAARAVREERQLAEALDLSARLYLFLGQPEKAIELSTELMELLAAYYWLPRPQSYLFTHALALRANGREAESVDHLRRAHERVMFVADKFTKESGRTGWLRDVRVNSEIVRSWRDISN
jgi:DNA-binding SARP family transcriptional activator